MKHYIFLLLLLTACGNAPEANSPMKFIPNLDSGQITAQLEAAGFIVERKHGADGTTWSVNAMVDGTVTRVDYYSSEVGKVQGLSAGYTVFNHEVAELKAGKGFLQSIATLPFDGTERDSVAEWFEQRYDQLGDHTDTIGVVEVTLFAVNEDSRTVRLRRL